MARWTYLDHGDPGFLDGEVSVPESAGAAVAIIDDALISFAGRSLVSGDEVVDRLLDLRNALLASMALRELEPRELASR